MQYEREGVEITPSMYAHQTVNSKTESISENCFIVRLIELSRQTIEIYVLAHAKSAKVCETHYTYYHALSNIEPYGLRYICNKFKLNHVSKGVQQIQAGQLVFPVLLELKVHFLLRV